MNPHKHPETVREYCERFDFDEVLYWLGMRLTAKGPIEEHVGVVDQGVAGDLKRNLELNHIWSCRQRPDYRSNFIRMLKEGHDWFGSNLSAGRMVAVLTKLVKREKIGEPEEFDLDEMREKVTGRFIGGIIVDYRFLDPLLRRLNDECCERLRMLERGAV